MLVYIQKHQNLFSQKYLLWALNGLQNLKKTFPLHTQGNCALHENLPNPDKIFFPSKHFTYCYPMEREFVKKISVPEMDPAILDLHKHLTVPVENISFFLRIRKTGILKHH